MGCGKVHLKGSASPQAASVPQSVSDLERATVLQLDLPKANETGPWMVLPRAKETVLQINASSMRCKSRWRGGG